MIAHKMIDYHGIPCFSFFMTYLYIQVIVRFIVFIFIVFIVFIFIVFIFIVFISKKS